MKIYVGHSKDYDFLNELYLPIINSQLGKQQEFIFPHLTEREFNSQEVIEQSDLFIAEVSIPTLGLGIEIGRAEMKNKKILCIYNEKYKLSSSLKFVNVDIISYNDKMDMINKIEKYIRLNFSE